MAYHEDSYFNCQCHSFEHLIRFTLDEWHNYSGTATKPELSIAVHLNNWAPWWRRVWLGLKYIVGHDDGFPHYDEMLFRTEDADRLMAMLIRLKEGERTA